MKKFVFLILLVSMAVITNAQNNFMVYSFKGNVSIIENKAESKAKIGKALTNASSVKLAANSMVTLICNETAMFTINKPGTYQLARMADSCRVSNSSMSANYVKYVWNQMTSNTSSPGSNRKAYMNTVGAVTRSVNNIWIDPRLDTVNYTSGEFPLSWKSYADAEEFEFSLYTMSNLSEPIYKTDISKKKVSIHSFISKLNQGNTYLWTAAVKGDTNEELKVLNYIPKETYEAVLKSFLNQGVGQEAPAEQAYRVAFMLEDAHYLSEAYQYYMKAATAAPDNPLYRSTLMSFRKDYEIK